MESELKSNKDESKSEPTKRDSKLERILFWAGVGAITIAGLGGVSYCLARIYESFVRAYNLP